MTSPRQNPGGVQWAVIGALLAVAVVVWSVALWWPPHRQVTTQTTPGAGTPAVSSPAPAASTPAPPASPSPAPAASPPTASAPSRAASARSPAPPSPAPALSPSAVQTIPGMPPVPDPTNLYGETAAGRLSPAVAEALARVYVPNVKANTVTVIDSASLSVVDTFAVGLNPQHVVPSYDLKVLWVANNAEGSTKGSLTPIDPTTGKPGRAVPVDDPYNLYFTPDGRSAIVVAEALKRLDFRDPHTMVLQGAIEVPGCAGVNHIDFAIDGKYLIATCEFQSGLVKIDLVGRTVLGYLALPRGGMPQDIRVSPDGQTFFVADMMAGGVHLIDGARFAVTGFLATGIGTHGLYPSRDGKKLYVANRGSKQIRGKPKGPGSVSVVDFASRTIETTWTVPGGGSPDMGNVSADGSQLWLSGRFDDVVYVFDTRTGQVTTIPVGKEPHGLTVWPQPGRYSLGHTGNMR